MRRAAPQAFVSRSVTFVFLQAAITLSVLVDRQAQRAAPTTVAAQPQQRPEIVPTEPEPPDTITQPDGDISDRGIGGSVCDRFEVGINPRISYALQRAS